MLSTCILGITAQTQQELYEQMKSLVEIDGYILSAGFEDSSNGQTITNWNNVGFQVQSNNSFPHKTGTRYVEKWVSDGSNVANCSLYQTLTLPSGTYMFTVDAMATQNNQGGLSGFSFVAKSGDWETGTELGRTAITGPSNFTAGDGTVIIRWYLPVTVTDGDVSIGLVTENCNANWVRFDQIGLYASGTALVFKQYIQEKINYLDAYLGELPKGYETLLYEGETSLFDTAMDLVNNSNDMDILTNFNDSLERIVAQAEIGRKLYATLMQKQTEATALLSATNYPGQGALITVFEEIEILFEDTEAMNPEFEQGIATLITGIKVYKSTQGHDASDDNPYDFTFYIDTPQFTKENGDPSVFADAQNVNWTVANNVVLARGTDFRLHNVAGKNCWNNWSDGACDYMNVYQEIHNLPSGFYSFSLYQTNNGSRITDQHAYAKSTYDKVDSPIATLCNATFNTPEGWEFLETGKVFVGIDGILRVGMESTMVPGEGSSGWFCFTDCQLTYYGISEEDPNEITRRVLITRANELQEQDFLAIQKSYLANAATVLENADISTADKANTAFTAMNLAIDSCRKAIADMTAFKAGSFGQLIAIGENNEGIYQDAIVHFIAEKAEQWNAMLENDECTLQDYEALKLTTDEYLDFAKSYTKAADFALTSLEENAELIQLVINNQIAFLNGASPISISQATKNTTDILGYGKAYEYITIQLENAIFYPVEAVAQAQESKTANRIALLADQNNIANYTQELWQISRALSLTNEGIDNGDDTKNVTEWIVNPTIEGSGNNEIPEGWQIQRSGGNTYTNTGQHWSDEANERYLDSYGSTGTLKYEATQVLTVPNGLYLLTCAGRSSGAGAYLFANGDTTQFAVDYDKAGTIWEGAEDESVVKLANSGLGYGWSWYSVEVNVINNQLTLGITNIQPNPDAAAWQGTWFSADDFTLTLIHQYGVGVDEVGEAQKATLTAYSQDGYIIVEGVEDYTITSLTGIAYSSTKTLSSGIYIVSGAGQAVKVIVP